MGLVTAIAVLAGVGIIVGWSALPARLRAARLDAELTSVIDRGTAELLGEQLRAGPRPVRVHAGRAIHGPFLDIDLDATRLHLRLYHEQRAPATDAGSVARLMGLTQVEGVGWVAVFDGPGGPQRYLGWLVERVAA
jgi:hypothetical protein